MEDPKRLVELRQLWQQLESKNTSLESVSTREEMLRQENLHLNT